MVQVWMLLVELAAQLVQSVSVMLCVTSSFKVINNGTSVDVTGRTSSSASAECQRDALCHKLIQGYQQRYKYGCYW